MSNYLLNKRNNLKIQNFINQYYDMLEIRLNSNSTKWCDADNLLAIISAYDHFDEKSKWEEYAYKTCYKIKQSLEKQGILSLAMFGQFGFQCFVVNEFSQRTGLLKDFSQSLNNLFIEKAKDNALSLTNKKRTNMSDYDLVFGVAGHLNYILELPLDTEQKEGIKILVKYLVSLTKKYNYQGDLVPKFHIPVEEQGREDEKIEFSNGNLNFGLAHGMIGVLVVLAKAKSKGIEVLNQDQAINCISGIYDKYLVIEDDVVRWPTQLALEDYLNGNFNDVFRSNIASWCYGNLGVASGLRYSAILLNDKEKLLRYTKYLENIINRNLKKYRLNNIAMCHGYSSVLYINSKLYYKTRNEMFSKKINEIVNKIFESLDCYSDKGLYNFEKMEELFEDNTLFLSSALGVVIAFLSTYDNNDNLSLLLGINY